MFVYKFEEEKLQQHCHM